MLALMGKYSINLTWLKHVCRNSEVVILLPQNASYLDLITSSGESAGVNFIFFENTSNHVGFTKTKSVNVTQFIYCMYNQYMDLN